jgi:hypothetical protein
MRRFAATDLIAGLIGAVLLAALLLAGVQRAEVLGTLRSGFSLPRLFEAIVDMACPAAMAQEQLKFRPVPAESASRFERLRVQRGTAEPTPAASPGAPATPESPEEPDPVPVPSRPDIVIGKSGSVMRIRSDIHVARDEVIRGDLNTVLGDITIDGHVQGNVVAMRGDVTLSSTARVDGDVVCIGGTLHEEPGAVVGGERVTAIGDDDGRRRAVRDAVKEHVHRGVNVMTRIISLMLALAVAWAVARFAPVRTAAAVETFRRAPAMSLGVGALIWALVIPSVVALALVVALLCITIIGIPLALAALLGYALFLCVLMVWGYVVGAIVLGAGISRRRAAAAAVATPGSVPVTPQPGFESHSPTMERYALMGVLTLGGAGVLAAMLQSVGGPLQALGVLIGVLSKLAVLLLTTIGAGAWLRSELATGLLGRWWSGRRNRPTFGGPPPGGAPVPSGPPTSPVAPMAPATATPWATPSPGYPTPGGVTPPAAPGYPPPPPPGYAPPPPGYAPPPPGYAPPPPGYSTPAPPDDPARYAPPPRPPDPSGGTPGPQGQIAS